MALNLLKGDLQIYAKLCKFMQSVHGNFLPRLIGQSRIDYDYEDRLRPPSPKATAEREALPPSSGALWRTGWRAGEEEDD